MVQKLGSACRYWVIHCRKCGQLLVADTRSKTRFCNMCEHTNEIKKCMKIAVSDDPACCRAAMRGYYFSRD